jgi:hypothetical protein
MLLLCTLQAKAQQDDTSRVATARVLFEEGLQFSDSAQWELAINRFRQTLRLRDSPQVRYNLALALNEHGQLVEASEELNIITNHPGVAEDIRVGASDLLASIVPRLARVQLALDGDLSNAEISMDGRSIDTALLNVPIICNPGTHRIVISRESADLEAREITAISGRVVEMRFAIPDAATPVALLGETAPEQPQPLVRQWWFWTAIGAVVAGSVTAIILAQEPGAPSPVIGDLNPGELVFE